MQVFKIIIVIPFLASALFSQSNSLRSFYNTNYNASIPGTHFIEGGYRFSNSNIIYLNGDYRLSNRTVLNAEVNVNSQQHLIFSGKYILLDDSSKIAVGPCFDIYENRIGWFTSLNIRPEEKYTVFIKGIVLSIEEGIVSFGAGLYHKYNDDLDLVGELNYFTETPNKEKNIIYSIGANYRILFPFVIRFSLGSGFLITNPNLIFYVGLGYQVAN